MLAFVAAIVPATLLPLPVVVVESFPSFASVVVSPTQLMYLPWPFWLLPTISPRAPVSTSPEK